MFYWNWNSASVNPTTSPFNLMQFTKVEDFLDHMDKYKEKYGADAWKALGQMTGQLAIDNIQNKEDAPIGLLRTLAMNTL